MKRKCGNCKKRAYSSMFGVEYCMWYEMSTSEEDEIREASDCTAYEDGTPSCLERDEYCPSATNGDYSPSCPWNAPGMTKNDFI